MAVSTPAAPAARRGSRGHPAGPAAPSRSSRSAGAGRPSPRCGGMPSRSGSITRRTGVQLDRLHVAALALFNVRPSSLVDGVGVPRLVGQRPGGRRTQPRPTGGRPTAPLPSSRGCEDHQVSVQTSGWRPGRPRGAFAGGVHTRAVVERLGVVRGEPGRPRTACRPGRRAGLPTTAGRWNGGGGAAGSRARTGWRSPAGPTASAGCPAWIWHCASRRRSTQSSGARAMASARTRRASSKRRTSMRARARSRASAGEGVELPLTAVMAGAGGTWAPGQPRRWARRYSSRSS